MLMCFICLIWKNWCHMKSRMNFIWNPEWISYEIPNEFHMKFRMNFIWNSEWISYEIPNEFHMKFRMNFIWNSEWISYEIPNEFHMKFQKNFIWNSEWISTYFILAKRHINHMVTLQTASIWFITLIAQTYNKLFNIFESLKQRKPVWSRLMNPGQCQ